VNAVERHSPVIPTAVEGSLLDPRLGGCKFEILFPQFFRLRPQLKPILPSQRMGQESEEGSSGMIRAGVPLIVEPRM